VGIRLDYIRLRIRSD